MLNAMPGLQAKKFNQRDCIAIVSAIVLSFVFGVFCGKYGSPVRVTWAWSFTNATVGQPSTPNDYVAPATDFNQKSKWTGIGSDYLQAFEKRELYIGRNEWPSNAGTLSLDEFSPTLERDGEGIGETVETVPRNTDEESTRHPSNLGREEGEGSQLRKV